MIPKGKLRNIMQNTQSNNKYKCIKERHLWKASKATVKTILFGIVPFSKTCQKCGFSDKRILQFDHIDPQTKRDNQKNNSDWIRYYISHPEEGKKEIQVLYPNCNWLKRIENNETKAGKRRININEPKLSHKNKEATHLLHN
jgi:hypothetical protein